jgi:hypothetical protein
MPEQKDYRDLRKVGLHPLQHEIRADGFYQPFGTDVSFVSGICPAGPYFSREYRSDGFNKHPIFILWSEVLSRIEVAAHPRHAGEQRLEDISILVLAVNQLGYPSAA